MVRRLKALGWGFLSCVLAACGGGGGAPVPGEIIIETEIRTNNIALTWNPAIASRYTLWSAPVDEGDPETPPPVEEFEIYEILQANFTGILLDASVHLFDWEAEAWFYVEGCNLNGCSISNFVKTSSDSSVEAIGYFKASNAGDAADDGNMDGFGTSVALDLSGVRLAVGAPFENNEQTGTVIGANNVDGQEILDNRSPGVDNAGAVYTYAINSEFDGLATLNDVGNWVQTNYIKAPAVDTNGVGEGDFFGAAIAMSGDGSLLVVGAPGEDGDCVPDIDVPEICDFDPENNDKTDSGAVFVYQNVNGFWEYRAYLKAEVPVEGAQFGSSVFVSTNADRIFIGAPGEDGSGDPACDVEEPDPSCDDTFANSGAVYVFDGSSASWTQQQYVRAPNVDAEDRFGEKLAAAGDGITLAVSAPGEDGDDSGIDAIDSPDEDNTGGADYDAGAVYVFVRELNDEAVIFWDLQAYLKGDGSADEEFGADVGLSDLANDLVAGAPGAGVGAAHVFHRDEDGDWSTTDPTVLTASNADDGDLFGSSVAIVNIPDPDSGALSGLVDYYGLVVVGAPGEASNSIGVVDTDEGDDSAPGAGAFYVFKQETEEEDSWNQFRYVKAPYADDDYFFATDLALNSSGIRVAAGSPGESSGIGGISGGTGGEDTNPQPDVDEGEPEPTPNVLDPADNTGPGTGALFMY